MSYIFVRNLEKFVENVMFSYVFLKFKPQFSSSGGSGSPIRQSSESTNTSNLSVLRLTLPLPSLLVLTPFGTHTFYQGGGGVA